MCQLSTTPQLRLKSASKCELDFPMGGGKWGGGRKLAIVRTHAGVVSISGTVSVFVACR